jgi:hypothetical protein
VRYVAAFGRFWWDFIVGDEWRFAVIVSVAAAAGALAAADEWARGEVIAVALAAWVMLAVAAVILVSGRRRAASER